MSHQNPSKWLAYAYSMIPNNSSSTYICVFIVAVGDEKHLPHFIHAAEQQWQLPLEAKGNKSHTKVTDIHHGKNTQLWSHQTKKRQIKPSSNQTHVLCTGQSQESCWSIQETQSTAQGRKARGKGSAGLRCLCQPQCQAPCAAPTDLLQLQVRSRNGPRGRWNLSSWATSWNAL